MLNYKSPMALEESAFAEEHHGMVYAFLRIYGLPADEFYDIAVFGYLRAVRKYLARPELREQYKFSTIAYRAMSCDVHHSREYWLRAKRNRQECPLDEERHTADPRDTVSEQVDNVIDFERVIRRLTPTQRRIASLRADGYRDKEIAAMCGIGYADVTVEMEDAKCCILRFQMEDTALAA